MSSYMCHRRGQGRQLWQTQHAVLKQHYQRHHWHKMYNRWQHVEHHYQAQHHHLLYASWIGHQRVSHLTETKRYQQARTVYHHLTKTTWSSSQGQYRHRVALWQQTVKTCGYGNTQVT